MNRTSRRGTAAACSVLVAGWLAVSQPRYASCIDTASLDRGAQSGCAPAQPLKDLPVGWLHLPTRWVDQWHGAFHDSVSGAFVYYSIASEHDQRMALLGREGDKVEEGVIAGHAYKVRMGSDARSRYEAIYADALQGPEEVSRLTRRLLPAKTDQILLISFIVGSQEWAFEAAIRDEGMEKRVRQLLLAEPRLAADPSGCDRQRRDLGGVAPKTFQNLQIGTGAIKTLEALGPAHQVLIGDDGGFGLDYMLQSGHGEVTYGHLFFDRRQLLVRKHRD